ncbi:MAG: DUF1598 domain-containing protein [Planctomycetota bacterium]|nr:DUF1598 domain-containing protein [Planctomycetota bacterium]
MNWQRAKLCSIFALMTLGVVGAISKWAIGGFGSPSGIKINAKGILSTQVFQDPTGQLTQQRINAAKASLNRELQKPSKLRKVSLNRLEKAIQKLLAEGKGETDEMKYLAGLTQITHVFYLPETKDIVIAGPAEGFFENIAGRVVGLKSDKTILQLQDLVVALRCFGPDGGQTRQIGCSIDPTQEGLKKMQDYLINIAGQVRPTKAHADAVAQGLKSNLGLQTVSVFGISDKTHFAQVMVEADYRMKMIGIGLEKPQARIPSYVSKVKPAQVAKNALTRWFFEPDYESVVVSDDQNAMQLVGKGVKLVTENEMVAPNGIRQRTNSKDLASMAFCSAFTRNYHQMADRTAVYAELKNLVDMSIVAAFVQKEDFYGRAGWDMEFFGDEDQFPVETYVAPKQVETAVNAIFKGNSLMTPVGGGVNIQPLKAIAEEKIRFDEKGMIKKVRDNVAVDGLGEDQWWWD